MMKKFEKVLTVVLTAALILAMSVFMAGCGNDKSTSLTADQEAEIDAAVDELVDAIDEAVQEEQSEDADEEADEEADTENTDAEDAEAEDADSDEENLDGEDICNATWDVDMVSMGEGDAAIYVVVTVSEDDVRYFEVLTNAETVGAALLEQGLIEGEDSEYGLYVKTVDGVTADYDVDGTYWAFYINGEYAMTGVDSTPVEAASTYEFAIEK